MMVPLWLWYAACQADFIAPRSMIQVVWMNASQASFIAS
jgi:hypothetical protein